MDLANLLGRCRSYEARAGEVYRSYAARSRSEPDRSAVWTELAHEEDEHEAALSRAASWLDPVEGWHTDLTGWEEALAEIEERLDQAASPEVGADPDRQIAAALALERTELDTLYRRLHAVLGRTLPSAPSDEHVAPLLTLADASDDQEVALEAALLRARAKLRGALAS